MNAQKWAYALILLQMKSNIHKLKVPFYCKYCNKHGTIEQGDFYERFKIPHCTDCDNPATMRIHFDDGSKVEYGIIYEEKIKKN